MISFKYENLFNIDNNSIILGIDEAGRGCLAGPVVSSCVWINQFLFPKELLLQINDSKKLSKNKRLDIFNSLNKLPKNTFLYSYSAIDNKVIDEINILNATLLSMKQSYNKLIKLISSNPSKVLIDGNKSPNIPNTYCIVKGDSLSYSIATASIIAKVVKDKLLNEIGEKYPQYEFYKNSGYCTKRHIELIKKYGVTEFHRKSYKPVSDYLNNFL